MPRVYRGPVRLPRSGVSPRQVARAGDVWRLLQEVAVDGSSAAGCSPERCRADGVGFLVSEMTVQHHDEVCYGARLEGATWVQEVRRATLFSRAVTVSSGETLLAAATQRWVHIALGPDGPRPTRAAPHLLDALAGGDPPETITAEAPTVVRPEPGTAFSFSFSAWHTWMDALGHANHPATVDWCDEALCRHLHTRGLDPVALVPLSEQVRFRRGVFAGDALTVTVHRLGRGTRGVVFSAEVRRNGSELVGSALLTRDTTDTDKARFRAAFD